MKLSSVLTTALSLLHLANASSRHDWRKVRGMHTVSRAKLDDPQITLANGTFTQPIDHKNPSLGTFEQYYQYTTKHWGGPGSPIVVFTPGEDNLTNYEYFAVAGGPAVLAKKLGAAVVLVEHRYWGKSSPYAELSTENLKYLTLENAIMDFVRFAQEVQLPFAPAGGANATAAPWVWYGGSYAGALAAWIESVAGGTYWAYWATSAPTQAMDYWQWFVPAQEGMPKNCSADLARVIEHIDEVGMHGTAEEQKALKTMFGMGELEHYDDFAAGLENGPWLWQNVDFVKDFSGFFNFCDTVENVRVAGTSELIFNATLPSEDGVGLEKALAGYASWMAKTFIPGFCESYGYDDFKGVNNVACFDTYNASSPWFTDMTLSNTQLRQWTWLTCNEPFGYWQGGAPLDRPTIASRLSNKAYWERQCDLFFPPSPSGATHGIAAGKTFDTVNAYTGGWNIDNSTRLLYTNGENDPWRQASVSSDFRPGGPLQSTEKVPVLIIPEGYHCSDLITENSEVNKPLKAVVEQALTIIEGWVKEFKPTKM